MKQNTSTSLRVFAAAAIALVAMLFISFSVGSGTRYALLVGLNEYRHVGDAVELKYAVNDVDALAERLTAVGYEVRSLTNERALRRDILGELQRYAMTLHSEDTFLLYFAGHGVRRPWGERRTYWLTYGAQLSFLDEEGIRLNHLLEYVQDIRADRKIVLLDHCFSGDIILRQSGSAPVEISAAGTSPADAANGGSRAGSSSSAIKRGVLPRTQLEAEMSAPAQGLVVLTAARNEAYELDDLQHGVFTEALLRAMRSREASQGKESLTLPQLIAYLKENVGKLSKQKQEFSDLTNGARLNDWIFIDKLPTGNLDEAKRKQTEYLERLNVWELEGHLDLQTLIWCDEALKNRVKSIELGTSLSVMEERIVNEIGRHMEVTGSADVLGPRLKQRIQAIRQTP